MKRFLTLYPETRNIHLVKDVGMVPYILYKNFGYDSSLATYENETYTYLNTEVPGLKLLFIKRIFNHDLLDRFVFLWKNRKKIDVLQLYHLDKTSLSTGLFFKIIRLGKVQIYLKLDASELVMNRKVNWFKRNLYGRILNSFDLVSAETTRVQKFLSRIYHANIQYVPNGFFDNGVRNDTLFSFKENTILTVGRIGSYQKATEVLCEAFLVFSQRNKGWKLEVVGPIDPTFKKYIHNLFIKNPSLKDQVYFIDEISDRALLDQYFQRAKIFVLPSRWESFGLVLLEAAKSGCYIISTAIAPAFDITANEKYGNLFSIDDISGLADCLDKIANDSEKLEHNCHEIQNYVYDKFYWVTSCKSIDHFLNVNHI